MSVIASVVSWTLVTTITYIVIGTAIVWCAMQLLMRRDERNRYNSVAVSRSRAPEDQPDWPAYCRTLNN